MTHKRFHPGCAACQRGRQLLKQERAHERAKDYAYWGSDLLPKIGDEELIEEAKQQERNAT